MAPERVGKNQDHRHHETVNGNGFNHRQPHEQGAGNGGGGVWLLRQRTQRGRHGTAFAQCWANAADGNRQPGSDDGYGNCTGK